VIHGQRKRRGVLHSFEVLTLIFQSLLLILQYLHHQHHNPHAATPLMDFPIDVSYPKRKVDGDEESEKPKRNEAAFDMFADDADIEVSS